MKMMHIITRKNEILFHVYIKKTMINIFFANMTLLLILMCLTAK